MAGAVRQWAWARAPRVAAAFLGAGLLSLGFEAGVSHFAGAADPLTIQWAPVLFSAIAGVALLSTLSARVSERAFRELTRLAGALAIFVGALGMVFHLRALARELSGEDRLTWAALEGALSVAPPPLAPATFLAIGLALLVLASPALLFGRRSARTQ